MTLTAEQVERILALAKMLKRLEPCAASVIDHQKCYGTVDARWCGREFLRVLDASNPLEAEPPQPLPLPAIPQTLASKGERGR